MNDDGNRRRCGRRRRGRCTACPEDEQHTREQSGLAARHRFPSAAMIEALTRCARAAASSVRTADLKVKPAASQRIRSLLVANRGEIAIRVMRAASELGLRTVAVYSHEDRFSLHRTKADESYLVGRGKGPIEAYLDLAEILRVARDAGAEAVHPGYGFLAENPEFAAACGVAGVSFIGPEPAALATFGNKVKARELAVSAGVPVMPASGPLPADAAECARVAESIGYPLMLKASWGGGGRGTRIVRDAGELADLLPLCRREARAAFGNDELYLEK